MHKIYSIFVFIVRQSLNLPLIKDSKDPRVSPIKSMSRTLPLKWLQLKTSGFQAVDLISFMFEFLISIDCVLTDMDIQHFQIFLINPLVSCLLVQVLLFLNSWFSEAVYTTWNLEFLPVGTSCCFWRMTTRHYEYTTLLHLMREAMKPLPCVILFVASPQ